MADPLTIVSAVSSIVSLAQLSAKVLVRLNQYRESCEELPAAFAHIRSQLPLLIEVLDESKLGGINNEEIGEHARKAIVSNLDGCTQQFEKLDGILARLVPENEDKVLKRMEKGMKSIWKESDVRGIGKQLQGYVTCLTFYCAWSSSKLDPANNDLLAKIKGWLAPPDPMTNLRNALEQRVANTGAWLLESVKYTEWKKIPGSFVWLHGSAGSGKMFLSSGVIQDLHEDCQKDPAKSLAYFFFDFHDSSKQGVTDMLGSLTSQLLERCIPIPEQMQHAFSASRNGRHPVSRKQLIEALKSICVNLPASYVVVDALDECTSRSDLMDALNEIGSWPNSNLRVILTSRREADIKDGLKTLVEEPNRICLESNVVDSDIRTYIVERLENDRALRRWKNDLQTQNEIKDALTSKAHGMIRWVVCQLDAVSKCLNRKVVLKTLQELPEDLDETYARILSNIDKANSEYALAILRWLAFSERPLDEAMLMEVTGIHSNSDSNFDPDEVLADPLDIVTICSSLVTVDDELSSRNPCIGDKLASSTITSSNSRLESDWGDAEPGEANGGSITRDFGGDIDDSKVRRVENEASSDNGREDEDETSYGHAEDASGLVETDNATIYRLATRAARRRRRRHVRLAHFSVKEYLLSDRIQRGPVLGYSLQFQQSNEVLTKSCLVYLLYFGRNGPVDMQYRSASSLARYAARYWTKHIRNLEAVSLAPSQGLQDLARQLLEKQSPAFKAWASLRNDYDADTSAFVFLTMPLEQATMLPLVLFVSGKLI